MCARFRPLEGEAAEKPKKVRKAKSTGAELDKPLENTGMDVVCPPPPLVCERACVCAMTWVCVVVPVVPPSPAVPT